MAEPGLFMNILLRPPTGKHSACSFQVLAVLISTTARLHGQVTLFFRASRRRRRTFMNTPGWFASMR